MEKWGRNLDWEYGIEEGRQEEARKRIQGGTVSTKGHLRSHLETYLK